MTDVFAARDHLDGVFFRSITSFTSCLFSLEIFNTNLNRYQRMLYMQEMDRGPAKILLKPAIEDT